ncbi:MAG: AmmeMemoRadiSam system protein B [Elusimicrobia bacterium]|nr:AmmeMemoRadiSam system protein B [Elusimicrobiota bacterium]
MRRLPAPVSRPPAVAGQFYPGSPKELDARVAGLLAAAPRREAGDVVALLSPHAGYDYSGSTAAAAYRALPKGAFDSVVVVGAGHRRAVKGAAFYAGEYRCSTGGLPFDAELAQRLMEESDLIEPDNRAHEGEHSVEVQVPFIIRTLGPVRAVCMVMNTGELDDALKVGRALAASLKGRRTLLVASTDLSHFPSAAGAELADPTTLEALATLDPAVFWRSNELLLDAGLRGLDTTCCGAAGTAAVLAAARDLGAAAMRTLELTHSGKVTGEEDSQRVVGYAAAAFVRGGLDGRRPLAESERAALLAEARGAIKARLSREKAGNGGLSALSRLNLPGAAFVTITEADGELRGCIGDLEPRQTLLDSVRRNAAAAAFADPRFPALTAAELESVRVEVSVLSPKRTAHWSEVRPGDGVVIERNGRGGVFLPQVWEKLPDPREFLEVLCSQKAGLSKDAYRLPGTVLRIFSVEKMAEMGKK